MKPRKSFSWNEEGIPFVKYCKFDSVNNLFFDGNGNLFNGVYVIYGAKVVFKNGVLLSYSRNGITSDYITKRITNNNPLFSHISITEIYSTNFKIETVDGFVKIHSNAKTNPKCYWKKYYSSDKKVLKEEGYLENTKKVGKWKFYDDKGKLIRKEKF